MNTKIRRPPLPIWLLTILILCVLILYIPMHNRYRSDYIDDAWSFSWAYNLWEHGEVFDTVFGYLDGDGGTSLFGRIYAWLYGFWGSLTGWSRPGGFVLSVLFLAGTAALWRAILRHMNYSSELICGFLFLMLLMEAYYSTAHSLRGDAMTFFLATLCFYLFILHRPFWSALVLCFAVETHPYGMVGLFYIFALITARYLERAADRQQEKKAVLTPRTVLLFTAGGLTGLAVYLALHWNYLGGLNDLAGRTGGNPFLSYFFLHRYSWRHWPELLLIIIALTVYLVKREYKNDIFIPVFTAFCLLFSILIPRGNFHYVGFLYPPFILMILFLAERYHISKWVLTLFLLFQMSQYAWLAWSQRDFSWKAYLTRLEQALPETETNTFIYGPPSGWFAFHKQNYHAYGFFGRAGITPDQLPKMMYVVKNGEMEKQGGTADLAAIAALYRVALLTEWDEPGHSCYTLELWEKKNEE